MNGISTLFNNNLMRGQIGQLQSQLADLEQQTSTGQKTNKYGDLGAGALTTINLSAQLNGLSAYQDTISQLQGRTNVINQALSNVRDAALNIQTLALPLGQGNPTTDPTVLKQAAIDAINSITSQLQSELAGRYLFSGQDLTNAPMANPQTLLDPSVAGSVASQVATAIAGAPTNVPSAIQSAVASSTFYLGSANAIPPTRISDNESISYGVMGNAPGIDEVLQGLYAIATTPIPSAGGATTISQADYQSMMQWASSEIGKGVTDVGTLVTNNGIVQQRLTAVATEQSNTQTVLKTQLGNLTNADMADVAMRLTALQTQLNAVYSVTAQLKSLSLVNLFQ